MTNRRNGPWIYPLLLAVQTVGAAIILWNGIPIYRQIVADASQHTPKPETLILAVVAVMLIQGAYWLRQRLELPLPQQGNSLLGHLVLFLARLSLIFATAMFSVVFFLQPEGLQISSSRVVALVAVLFSMFCYTLELERLGRALYRSEAKAETSRPDLNLKQT